MPPANMAPAEDVNDGTYDGGNMVVTGHIASFLDQMNDIQDRFAGISPEEKEQTRKRAMSLMQSLFASLTIETAPASSMHPAASGTRDEADTDSLAVQWYKQA